MRWSFAVGSNTGGTGRHLHFRRTARYGGDVRLAGSGLSFQGVSDEVAYTYMERHGRPTWRDLKAKLGRSPTLSETDPGCSALRRLHEFAFVQFNFRAADHQLLHKKRITEPENCADVVVLGHASKNDRDRPPLPGKKLVTGKFSAPLSAPGACSHRRGQHRLSVFFGQHDGDDALGDRWIGGVRRVSG